MLPLASPLRRVAYWGARTAKVGALPCSKRASQRGQARATGAAVWSLCKVTLPHSWCELHCWHAGQWISQPSNGGGVNCQRWRFSMVITSSLLWPRASDTLRLLRRLRSLFAIALKGALLRHCQVAGSPANIAAPLSCAARPWSGSLATQPVFIIRCEPRFMRHCRKVSEPHHMLKRLRRKIPLIAGNKLLLSRLRQNLFQGMGYAAFLPIPSIPTRYRRGPSN
jgi:hypothetical protein